MGVVDRIILSIYTLLLIAVSSGVIVVSLRLISLDMVWTGVAQVYGQWKAAVAASVFLLISLRLLYASLRFSPRRREAVVHQTELGNVQISLEAVANLVEKISRNMQGVHGARTSVAYCPETGLQIGIKMIADPESNIPALTADLQKQVKSYMKHTVGIELVDINILVDNISHQSGVKQRVQ